MEEWITQLYKSKGGFGKSTLENRRSTAVEKRRDYRNSVLTKLRQIPQNMSPLQVTRDVELPQEKPEEKKSRRLEMLEKWKMEKERKKLEAQKNKKPIFKVCRVESNGNFDELYNFIKGKKIVKGKSQFPAHNDGGARHSRSISSHQVLKNESVQKDVKFLQNKGLSKKHNVKVNCKSTKPATIISNQPTSRAPHSSEKACENQQGTSNGRNVSSNGRNVLSNGRNVLSNGRNVLSNGRNVSKKAKAHSNDTKVNSVEVGEMNSISLDRKLTKQSCDSESSTSRSGGLNISTSEQTKMENNKSSRVSLGKSMLHDSENQVDESSRTICDNDYTLQIESLDTASVRTERKSLRITLQKVNVDKTIATENKRIEGNSSTDLDATGRHLDESEILKNKGTPNRHNSEYIPQCYVPLTPLFANRCLMESTPLLYDSKKEKTSRITPKNRRETFSKGVTLSTPNRENIDSIEFIKGKRSANKKKNSAQNREMDIPQDITVISTSNGDMFVSDQIVEDLGNSSKSPKKTKITGSSRRDKSSTRTKATRRSSRRVADLYSAKENISDSENENICSELPKNRLSKSKVSTSNEEMFVSDEVVENLGNISKSTKNQSQLYSSETEMDSSKRQVILINDRADTPSKKEEITGSSRKDKSSARAKPTRRSSRRIADVDSVKENISDSDNGNMCSELPKSQPSKSNTSRKSIINTPKAKWNLRVNDTFEDRTPRNSSTKRKGKKRENVNTSDPIGEEFFTPNNNAGEKDDVFETPNEAKVDEEVIPYVSPFVTTSRGKSAARKEYLMRKSLDGLNSSIAGATDPKSPKAAAAYFERILSRETASIQELCETWQNYKESGNVSEDACGLIDMTIGQSNLLLTKKFKQFRGLIEKCKNNDQAEMRIQCEDLHGFWDMIFKQVQDLEKRFDNLEDMKKNNWLEDVPIEKTRKKRATKPKQKKGGRSKSTTEASALLREAIQAARKKNAVQQSKSEGDLPILIVKKNATPNRKILANSSLSNIATDSSTPAKGILKATHSKSEKRKNVVFKEMRASMGEKENKLTPAFSRRDTPIPTRRSERISLGRNKLTFD